ncbi:3-deoxy-8-phosphooctulonate synthase [Sinorhizobium meliloti]|uniref:3-deoxy-8-phosphooctulonate synthase n=1 Tax=Rhizobium meliloti TaxID=382 RepID=UPI00031388C7|nr:3-deoxy-8-phosphooctulonate synthase [Sinorhizobium meliloti]
MSDDGRGVDVKTVKLGSNIEFSNTKPMVFIGGVNVLESRDLAMRVAETMKAETARYRIPYVFKASFDKANRSSNQSYRGPGIEEGMRILQNVRDGFDVPILTDVHLPEQAAVVAEVCDILQLPAFLARQTDLIAALAKTRKIVNVKKPQFMSPRQIGNVIDKLTDFGNDKAIICERGTCFGYDNLVVDMLGFSVMKDITDGSPIIFDVTHSLQIRDPSAKSSGGRRKQVFELARSGLALGLAGVFLEAHPDPDRALCDGPSALPLDKLPAFLGQMKAIDDLVKSFQAVELS